MTNLWHWSNTCIWAKLFWLEMGIWIKVREFGYALEVREVVALSFADFFVCLELPLYFKSRSERASVGSSYRVAIMNTRASVFFQKQKLSCAKSSEISDKWSWNWKSGLLWEIFTQLCQEISFSLPLGNKWWRGFLMTPNPSLISWQKFIYYRLWQAKLHSSSQQGDNKLEERKTKMIFFPCKPTPIPWILQSIYRKNYPVRILSSRSTLFLALSSWWSTLFRDFSWQSTLLRDLSAWLNESLSFSNLSVALEWFFSLSGWSVLRLGFSLRSVLFLGISKKSVLFRGCSYWSVLFLALYRWDGGFSTVATNFCRCLIYSG